jgi:hypothetical protein
MTTLTRTYTVDQLDTLGLPYENYLARDSEDERRSYTNWRIVFRDPADDTTWSIIRSEPKNEMGEPSWWYSYDDENSIVAKRVEVREVTVTQWVEVKTDAHSSNGA